jgi:hypothetical protein
MRKKRLIITLSILGIAGFLIYRNFFSLQGVPKGELIRTIPSPNGEYSISTYFKNGGSLSMDAARGELVDLRKNTRKTIYWNYPDEDPYVEWTNNSVVIIGNQTIDISKDETYDWRVDKKWVRELPRQFPKSTDSKQH